VSPATVRDGPGPAARRKTRRTWFVAGFLVAVVVVAAVVAAIPPRASASGGKLGPYTLNSLGGPENSLSVQLSFPLCTNVTVQWNITADPQWEASGEGNVTFTVWTPASVQNSTCRGTPPVENLTCPSQGCPVYIGQPACIETGAAGTCAFQATQTNYTFLLYSRFDQGAIGILSFTASYS